MNIKRFFEEAKKAGLEECQIIINKSSSFSYTLYHEKLDNYSVSQSEKMTASGIYHGKYVAASTEKCNNNGLTYLIQTMLDASAVVEKESEIGLFPGSKKYHKRNVYSAEILETTPTFKINLGRRVESLLKQEEGVNDIAEISYSEEDNHSEFYNSYGLHLKDKANDWALVAFVLGKDGERTIDAGDIYFGNSFSSFHPEEFAHKIGEELRKKIGATSYQSGKYPVIIDREVFATFVSSYIRTTSAELVQKHLSPLANHLGEKIASSRLTIEERPLDKTIFHQYFDDEGVATQNKAIIKNGVLTTYLHNRETAKKDGTESTGNAVLAGGKLSVKAGYLKVKAGHTSLDELAKKANKGVYITSIAGYGTGLNPYNGDFSCQAQGFAIEEGKISRPLTLITLSGNLLQLMKDILMLDSRAKLNINAVECPDVLIKKLSIGGE